MSFKLRLIPAAAAGLMLVACGGGSNPSPPTYTPTGGTAVDGYLQFSKVVCDANENGVADVGEPVSYTDINGRFTFAQGCTHGVIVTGGVNQDTRLLFTGQLKAPAGATVATPMTTLMSSGMTTGEVISALGLSPNTDLLHTDPAATSGGVLVDPLLYKKTLALQQLLQKSTELFAGLTGLTGSVVVQAIYGQVATTFATALKAGSPLIPAGANPVMDVTVVRAVLLQAALAAKQVLATGAFGPAVQAAMDGIDLDAVAAVVAPAMQVQAQTLLGSTGANITTLTIAAQSSTYITDYVKSKKADLTGTPTAAAVAALGAKLTADVISGTSSIGPSNTGTVLFSFDEDPPAFTDMGAYGGALPSVEAGPAGGNGKALKIVKPTSPDAWGGVFFTAPTIAFTADRKVITARVNASRAGAVIKFKVEIPGGGNVEVASAPTGAANTWSTVSWDFSAVDLSKGYKVIAITPDQDRVTDGQTYYIDDITLAPAATQSADTVPPTLSITDNVAAASATGAVSFNFSFSEDVGTSFDATDVVVTGGTPGALTKVDSTHYSMVVTPAANATGTITVNVGAGKFSDLASNNNTAAASASQAFDTTHPSDTGTVLLSFDEATPAFTDMGAYGGALPDVVAGPADGSGKALKIVKPTSPEKWGGVYFTVAPIAFSADRKVITARVNASRAGVVIKFKVEIPGGGNVEVASAPTGAANTWSTLSWDFSAVDLTKGYKTIAITPDQDRVTDGQIYYIDDITLAPATTPVTDTVPPTLSITDNVTAANATGPVTFNFSFSEDVGTSFDATDIVVAGGAPGALTKVDATHYSMVVTPAANATGSIAVNVGAGKFSDLASNNNTVAASASQAFDTTMAGPTDYLYLANNAISFDNGTTTTSYTMAQFQSAAGIAVKWPMASKAALKLNLLENGSFAMAAGQTLSAAVSITQDTPSGSGEVKAYIDKVSITKTGHSISLTVPTNASAMVYGVSGNGQTKAVISFADAVRGVTNTLTSAVGGLSTVVLGDVVNYAVNGVSNDFTGMYALRGKYKVAIVVTELPLRKADGSQFPTVTIQVPTQVNGSGAPAGIVPVTGYGLEGYITLTD